MKPLLIIASLFLVSAFGYLYKDVIINLFKIWIEDGNYSHGFFVPVIVGYILWAKRKELMVTPTKPFWPAAVLVLLSGLLLVAGQLAVHGFTRHLSLMMMVFSLPLLLFGKEWTRKLLFPIALFAFMFPFPQFMRKGITGPLQLFSSYISVKILSLMNYPIFREGNIIQLPDIELSVAEACSGLRSLVALTFLATIAAYFVLKDNRIRIILILCAVPIAIILNWVRITGTVLLANHWGLELALGFFHNFSGLIIFGIATISIASVMLFLSRREKAGFIVQSSRASALAERNTIGLPVLIVPAVLLTFISLLGNYLFSLKPGPPIDLGALSSKIGTYRGQERQIDPSVTEASGVTQDKSIIFHQPNEPTISLYLGYYRTSMKRTKFFHGADVCLPGAGWEIKEKKKIALEPLGYKANQFEAMKYVSKKMGVTEVMVTWVQAGMTVGTGAKEFRLKLVWDSIWSLQYNDAIKVMVQTTVTPQESEAVAVGRLVNFIYVFYPHFLELIN